MYLTGEKPFHFCLTSFSHYFVVVFFKGSNADARVQALSENCKDVQIFCQHTYSLYKGIKTHQKSSLTLNTN